MKTIEKKERTKRQMQILIKDHYDSHCNDSCTLGANSCAYQKRCDILHKRYLLLSMLLFISIVISAQRLSKKYEAPQYTSYVSYDIGCPIYVSYQLYKGGGTCPRDTMRFRTNDDSIANASSYLHSGYDTGHLCAAADFAYDCSLEDQTFRYENAIPQKPGLNRGSWEIYEAQIRSLSKKYHMLIICGGFNWGKKVGKLAIPANCFKVYKNLDTKKITYMIFKNCNLGTYSVLDSTHFYQIVPYKIQYLLK